MALRDHGRRLFLLADRVDRKVNLTPYSGRLDWRGPGHRGLTAEPNPEELEYEAAHNEKRRWPLINRLFNVVPEDEVGKGPVEPGKPDY